MTQQPSRPYIGYEYKEIPATGKDASLLLDCYESFGWVPDENRAPAPGRQPSVVYLKRDRKIVNKMELTRLQRNFESCIQEITMLEQSGRRTALMWALLVGLAGTAFMAGSVFAVTSTPPRILLTILLAVPGFAGWVLPVFLYRFLLQSRTRRTRPLIDAKYEEVYQLCEKGHALL